MTLQQLTYLVTVAECGNITEAAEKLYISQPSLSAAIQKLEKEMNITAFVRSSKGVVVTREGERLLSFARMLLEQAENMKEQFVDEKKSTPKFSISCQHYSFAVNAFVDLIKEYDIEASSGEERNYDGAYSDELNKVLEDMKEGDISDVVETDAGYMVVRMDNPDDTDYKEYALHYAAMQSVQTQIGTLQQSWIKEAGCESLEPDADAIAKIDIKELCKQMKENGIYE